MSYRDSNLPGLNNNEKESKLNNIDMEKYISNLNKVGTYQRNRMREAYDVLHEAGWSDNDIKNWYIENGMTVNNLNAFTKNKSEIDELIADAISTKRNAEGAAGKFNDIYSMLDRDYANYTSNMILNANDANAQQYKADQYAAINEYENSLDRSLAASEMSAYQQIGQQQLELESQIAKQRLQALKSGTTSAQLASQQLANMFAAQSGAAQIAGNVMQSRLQNVNTIAQSRMGVTQNLYNLIQSNQATAANMGAQLSAAKASAYSTLMQPYAQYNAFGALSGSDKDRLAPSK